MGPARGAGKRLADATGTLAAVVRAACDGGEVVDEAPELVRRMLHWQITRPAAGAPYLCGDAPPPPPEPTEFPRDIYGQATVRPMPDGGLYFDVSHVPQWQAFERWRQHKQHSRYAPAWGVSQWPGASEWIWLDPWLGRHRIRRLVNPDLPFPAAAADQVVAQLGDDGAGTMLATDIVTQAIGDGRLTSAVLGLALAAGFAAPTGARLAPATVHSGLDGAAAPGRGRPGPHRDRGDLDDTAGPAAVRPAGTPRRGVHGRRRRPGVERGPGHAGDAPAPGPLQDRHPDRARPRPSRRRPVDAGGGPGRARRAGPLRSSARSHLQP